MRYVVFLASFGLALLSSDAAMAGSSTYQLPTPGSGPQLHVGTDASNNLYTVLGICDGAACANLAAVKAAATAALTSDPALVITLSPNSAALATTLATLPPDSSGNNLTSIVNAINASTATPPFAVYQAGASVYAATGGTGNALFTGTAVAAAAAAHTVTGYFFDNTANTSACFIQFFDVASGSVTLGTTVPKFVVAVPAGGYADDPLISGVSFGTSVTLAATTTRTGSTAPVNGVAGNVFYK